MTMNFDKLTESIDLLLSEAEHIILAIDGPCAGGKTTLAARLAQIYDANVFHADDFFLRTEQRTAERLSEIGGNFDRERFMTDILLPLSKNESFSYRPFSCKNQTLGNKIKVTPKKLSIVEGSYCHHPYFDGIYNLRVFLNVSDNEQRRRILIRNPDKAEKFFTEWIPKENAYFKAFNIKEKADIVLY